MSRRMWALAAMTTFIAANTGCIINQYDSNPLVRTEQELIDSENLRQARDAWRRFWMNDQPSHLTPYRVHGGVGPASSVVED